MHVNVAPIQSPVSELKTNTNEKTTFEAVEEATNKAHAAAGGEKAAQRLLDVKG